MGAGAIQEVKQIADPSRAFRQHVHDELSIAHVWSGATLAWIDGAEVPICGECVVVIPPGVVHACNPVAESGWRYTLALLDPQVCAEAGERLFDAPYRILPSTERLRESFWTLRQDSGPEFLMALGETLAGTAGATRTPLRSQALRRVEEHLRSCWTETISLEELSTVAGLSKHHLVRAFREAYGLTPHAYHLNLRVNEAKIRLRQGQDLAWVALDSGFYDQSHFTRVFTRCVGMTPAAYQRATAIPSKIEARHRH